MVLIVIVGVGIRLANGDKSNPPSIQVNNNSVTSNNVVSTKSVEVQKVAIGDKITFKNAEVTVTNLENIKDYEGKDVLRVTYTYTNLGDKENMPMTAISMKAFQKGVSKDLAFVTDDGANSNASNQVKPGAIIENCQYNFQLIPADGDVTLEIQPFFNMDRSQKVEMEIEI